MHIILSIAMSFDRIKPQTYAKLRLKPYQLEPFFRLVRDRKFSKTDALDDVMHVTKQPFEENKPFYEKQEPGTKSGITKKRKKRIPNPVKKSVKVVKKPKLEKKLKKAKF